MAHRWQELPACALQRGDLVLMGPGHLRVVTAVNPAPGGRTGIRVGATWYEVDQQQMFAVNRKTIW